VNASLLSSTTVAAMVTFIIIRYPASSRLTLIYAWGLTFPLTFGALQSALDTGTSCTLATCRARRRRWSCGSLSHGNAMLANSRIL